MLFIGNKRSLLWSGLSLAGKIKKLFAAAQPGAWYDFGLLTQEFQGSAGTVAVTAVEQPLGLVLDGKTGYAKGAELCFIGIFDSATGWTVPAGWAIGSGVATATATSASLRQSGTPLTVGKTYAVEFDWTQVGGTLSVRVGGGTATTFNTSGHKTAMLVAVNATGVEFYGGAVSGQLDNISVKEVQGNHLTQATAGARPVLKLSGGYAAGFDGIDDSLTSTTGGGATSGFFFCGAIKPLGGAGTFRYLLSDQTGNTGVSVAIDTVEKLRFYMGNGAAMTVTSPTTEALSLGATALLTVWDDGVNLNAQINSGTVQSIARPTASAGTTGFTVGKNNTSAANYFNGNIYPSIYRTGTPLTAAERAAAQAWCKSKAGL